MEEIFNESITITDDTTKKEIKDFTAPPLIQVLLGDGSHELTMIVKKIDDE